MFITRECDYAVRVVRALWGESRLSVSDICEKESVTAPFAYKILKKLQKAEIVKGYRGVHGGYSLNEGLDELTLIRRCSLLNVWIRNIAASGTGRTVCHVWYIKNWYVYRMNW